MKRAERRCARAAEQVLGHVLIPSGPFAESVKGCQKLLNLLKVQKTRSSSSWVLLTRLTGVEAALKIVREMIDVENSGKVSHHQVEKGGFAIWRNPGWKVYRSSQSHGVTKVLC